MRWLKDRLVRGIIADSPGGYSLPQLWRVTGALGAGAWLYDTIANGRPNAVGTGLMLAVVAGVIWLERTRARLRRTRSHRVMIYRVVSDDYFFAQCDDCSWIDAPYDSAESARRAARAHTADVGRSVVNIERTGVPARTS